MPRAAADLRRAITPPSFFGIFLFPDRRHTEYLGNGLFRLLKIKKLVGSGEVTGFQELALKISGGIEIDFNSSGVSDETVSSDESGQPKISSE